MQTRLAFAPFKHLEMKGDEDKGILLSDLNIETGEDHLTNVSGAGSLESSNSKESAEIEPTRRGFSFNQGDYCCECSLQL